MVDKMRVAIMFFNFVVKKEKSHQFELMQFLGVDTDQIATFSLLTYLRLTQFYCIEIGNDPEDFIFLNEIRKFDTPG